MGTPLKKVNRTVMILLIFSGLALLASNIMRANAGWFENGFIIFFNNLTYVLFFGLLTGYVVANVLKKKGR